MEQYNAGVLVGYQAKFASQYNNNFSIYAFDSLIIVAPSSKL